MNNTGQEPIPFFNTQIGSPASVFCLSFFIESPSNSLPLDNSDMQYTLPGVMANILDRSIVHLVATKVTLLPMLMNIEVR